MESVNPQSLRVYDILQYLTNDVPEPPVTDAQAQKVWKQAGLKGKITIHSTLNTKQSETSLRTLAGIRLRTLIPRLYMSAQSDNIDK
jgi:hypothetical protein